MLQASTRLASPTSIPVGEHFLVAEQKLFCEPCVRIVPSTMGCLDFRLAERERRLSSGNLESRPAVYVREQQQDSSASGILLCPKKQQAHFHKRQHQRLPA